MPDFRFEGTSIRGKSVQGIVKAPTFADAKTKVKQLASQHKVKVSRVRKRKTFIYKCSKPNETTIRGEQKAFTKEEVRLALEHLGYEKINIQPKLIDIKFKPPDADVVTFVRLSADLLREKLTFNEVFQLLISEVEHPTLKEALKTINNDLRQGKDGEEAFIKQEKVLGRFSARMLGLASKSGNMVTIYESTAKFLERRAEFKRNLRSALIMPLFTVAALFGACFYYVGYIFPETAKLFTKLGTDLPPMTAATLKFSDLLVNNIFMF